MAPAQLSSIDLTLEPDTREHAAGDFTGILSTNGGAEWHLFIYLFFACSVRVNTVAGLWFNLIDRG